VSVFRKHGHLTFRVSAIGAVRVGLDQLAYREAISGFIKGDGIVFHRASFA
jgi:hypothetical protein